MNQMTILLFTFALVLIGYIYQRRPQIERFGESDINSFYSDIDDNIANGNFLSWSNKPNPYININQKGPRNAIIYQGHGIPLPHEDHPTVPVKDSMFYFNNYSCRPECCLFSPYSCSNGCVCWEAPPEKYSPPIQSLRTTPTS